MNNLDNCGDSQLGEPKKRPADGNEESDDNSNSHDIQNWIYPEDGLLVGTDAIFTSSPNVIPIIQVSFLISAWAFLRPQSTQMKEVRSTTSKPTINESTYCTPRQDICEVEICIPMNNATLFLVDALRYGHCNLMDVPK